MNISKKFLSGALASILILSLSGCAVKTGNDKLQEVTNENIDGKTERNGLELSSKTYLGEFTISQAYTYLNAKIKDGVYEGKTIPWVPKNKYSIRTDYKINDISIGAEYLYIGSLYSVSDWNNNLGKVENYSLVNLSSSYNYKILIFIVE